MHHPSVTAERVTEPAPKTIRALNELFDEGMRWDGEQDRRFLADPDNLLVVGRHQGVIVGFLTAYRLQRFDARGAEVLLYEIGVDEAHRRHGVARAMIELMLAWAAEGGATESWVLTEDDNVAALALYAATGAERDDLGTVMLTYHHGPSDGEPPPSATTQETGAEPR